MPVKLKSFFEIDIDECFQCVDSQDSFHTIDKDRMVFRRLKTQRPFSQLIVKIEYDKHYGQQGCYSSLPDGCAILSCGKCLISVSEEALHELLEGVK